VLTVMFSPLSGLNVIFEGLFRHITTVAGCRARRVQLGVPGHRLRWVTRFYLDVLPGWGGQGSCLWRGCARLLACVPVRCQLVNDRIGLGSPGGGCPGLENLGVRKASFRHDTHRPVPIRVSAGAGDPSTIRVSRPSRFHGSGTPGDHRAAGSQTSACCVPQVVTATACRNRCAGSTSGTRWPRPRCC
jgi:hypothetical protein